MIADLGHVVSTCKIRLKVKLCLFVLDSPTHNLPPDSKNYIAFSREKVFFYRLLPKRPIACQESGFYHMHSYEICRDTPNGKNCINEREKSELRVHNHTK